MNSFILSVIRIKPIRYLLLIFTRIGLLGFRDITPCEVGKSEHPALNGIEGHFKELPYEFDLLETMIFEATK